MPPAMPENTYSPENQIAHSMLRMLHRVGESTRDAQLALLQ